MVRSLLFLGHGLCNLMSHFLLMCVLGHNLIGEAIRA